MTNSKILLPEERELRKPLTKFTDKSVAQVEVGNEIASD